MAKFRKQPVEVEAVQYKGWMTDEVKDFVGDSLIEESRWGDEGGPVGYFIKTLEEADTFVKEKLCTKVAVSKWVEVEVKNVSC